MRRSQPIIMILQGFLDLCSFSCKCITKFHCFKPVFRFLAAVITYFIVGVIVMKFYKGATGKELVPNYEFWSDLPFLIKVRAIHLHQL